VAIQPDLPLIYAVAFLRSLGVGLMGVLLGVYLYRLGFSSTAIGLVIGAGLAGGAVAMLVMSLRGDRLGRRRTLLVLALLGAAGGLGLALAHRLWGLLPVAFFSMLNGMGTDRTAAYALEQAIIPELVPNQHRTWALSWYTLVLDAGHALGALAAALPVFLATRLHLEMAAASRIIFLAYAGLNLLGAVFYLFLSPRIEVARTTTLAESGARLSPQGKSLIARLAALASIDSFGGGFLSDAIVAYWFFRRFGVQEQRLAILFLVVHLLNAVSYLGAAWLARRIGLLNTMVFTHLPSSVFLVAMPFAPRLPLAVGLFLLREALVEMDVPTRQSYLFAVIRAEERTFASALTNLTRNLAWATASSLSGVLMQRLAFSSPLFLGGSLKIVYDLLLFRAFRRIKPPEETPHTASREGSS